MKTLIEIYDERASENVMAAETFRPEKVVYLCPAEIAQDADKQRKMRNYFKYRGQRVEVDFYEVSLFEADKVYGQLVELGQRYEDCAVDITGGTDAALFAAGMYCQETGMPAFTYSRRQNTFYNISNAEFASGKVCELEYTVEDFFKMAGGELRQGRVDNRILGNYMDKYDDFFRVFLRNRRSWARDISYMQRISQVGEFDPIVLDIHADYYQKGERGGRIWANEQLFNALQSMGFISNLKIVKEESISFKFADEQVRTWLRDVGSFLELYMYKMCRETGIFKDVVSSAIVDWDGTNDHDSVSNELDVVATRGVVPLFISCKATMVKTEALNELAILRDRFGGKGAKAAIVTTEYCNAASRHRAAQLGITVIDREELETGVVPSRLRTIMKVK